MSPITNPAWQPTAVRPWPDQVNEQLSRQGIGMEEHDLRITDLAQRITDLTRRIIDLEIAVEKRGTTCASTHDTAVAPAASCSSICGTQ